MKNIKLIVLALFVSIISFASVVKADISTRIIGGQLVNSGEYPFVVSLAEVYNGQLYHFCGGSLIDKRWVLTAAHCVEAVSNFKVRVNSLDSASGGEVVDIEFVRVPSDRIWNNVTGNDYDIALVKLARDVTSVSPIKLASSLENNLLLPGTNVTVAGWGATSNSSYSRYLLKVNVPVVNQTTCITNYQLIGESVTDDMVCAGAGGRDSCQGDSGGPLIFSDSSGKYLAGLVSYGYQCALADYPGVYTRVSSHLDWIKSISGVGAPSKVIMITQNGDTTDTSPTFSWSAVSGAVSYDIQVVVTGAYGNNSASYSTTATSFTLPVGIQGQYSIKVRAKSGQYFGEYSNPLVLNVYLVPAVSAVLSPTNGQRLSTTSAAISWRASTNTKSYNLVIRNLTTARNYNVNGLTGTTYTYNNLVPGKYSIAVDSVNGNKSTRSVTTYFYINLPNPVLNAVTANANKKPTFTWAAISGATKYRLYLENINTKVIQDLPNISGTTYTPAANLASGAYKAYLMAMNSDVTSGWSLPVSFSVNFDAPVFTVVSTGVARPTVTWTLIAGAPKYEVFIKSGSVPSDILTVTVAGNTYTPTRNLRVGSHDVWMRVVSPGVVGTWSAPKRIVVK